MNKEILNQVCNRISQAAPAVLNVKADEGELNRKAEARGGLTYPACLVDVSYAECQNMNNRAQRIKAEVSIRIAFDLEETNIPGNVTASDFRMDLLNNVHQHLQGWSAGDTFLPLNRLQTEAEQREDMLKVYKVTYGMSCIENNA